MRIHVLQHVPFETPAAIEYWLQARGARVSTTRFFEDASLPALDDIDGVIALGGPMSVNDEAELPWLVAEKAFVRQAVAAGKGVLGLCLGAQLIASAHGAAVRPGPHKEVGWFPIEGLRNEGGFEFPPALTVFHWHGETFELPVGARHLARSAGCENQAFQLGARTVGLQFHLEMLEPNIERLVENCREDLTPGRYVSHEGDMLADYLRYGPDAGIWLNRLLDYLWPQVSA
ncbi:MAG TPA: type 1 glutamine amidotransferase [Polyangiaceae bacterium]|nr:type 1 glutamine amidotransferase [Polyangiaceae bacterium]